MRPCGMATPWPSPVVPRRSRANRLSKTRLRAMPSWFSNKRPACSNRRFLLETCRSSTMRAGVRSLATRLIAARDYTRFLGALFLDQLVLVAQHLAVELVGEEIDRRVQVLLDALAVQVLAAHVQRDFGFLALLVDGEDDVGVDDVVEMPADALDLGVHVAAQRRGHFDMMTAHIKVHS